MSETKNAEHREADQRAANQRATDQHPAQQGNGNGDVGVGELAYAPYTSATFMSPGFPGMKSTSMEDNVESWPCGVQCDFGCIATKGASPNGTGAMVVSNGGAGAVAGAVVHDHLAAVWGHYFAGMAVSIMTKGRLWCAVDGAGTGIVEGAPVNFNPANGKVTAGTGTLVPHAAFRGVMQTYYDYPTGVTTNIAEVEMHYPGAA
jgi:hypothetical protein